MWWDPKELDRLREEQKPKMEQPSLRLPVPMMDWEPPKTSRNQPDDDMDNGVCIIDMF